MLETLKPTVDIVGYLTACPSKRKKGSDRKALKCFLGRELNVAVNNCSLHLYHLIYMKELHNEKLDFDLSVQVQDFSKFSLAQMC